MHKINLLRKCQEDQRDREYLLRQGGSKPIPPELAQPAIRLAPPDSEQQP